jgi:uncharacterized membrane protein
MPKRSISARQRDWLHDELQVWRAEAILSEEQGRRILDLYETLAEAVERQRSRAVFTLIAVAGLLVGLAVLLLIGYNWEEMPAGLKLVVMFGAILGTYTGAFYLRYTRGARVASELVFFLGCLFYGAGIWLVAQIFHLSAHYPDGVWWWALGVLPFALRLDTLLLHALLVALLGIWTGIEVLRFSDLGGWFFGRWDFVPNGAYTLPLLALPGVIWAYRKNSPTTVGLYAPLLAWWVILQPFAWRLETNPIYFIGGIRALFLLLAESHGSGSPFAIPYRLWGTLLTGGVLVPLSFYEFNEDLFRQGPELAGLVQTLAILVLALVTIGATWLVQQRLLGEPIPFSVRLADLIRRQWLPFAFVALMVFLPLWESLVRSLAATKLMAMAIVPTILANVAMIACALWLIAVGLREDRGRPFAAGVLYFLLWAVLRYVDLFGEFGGMLGASLMFFLCGATLFGVALYWRQRKGVRHA